ncbi:MAG: asparagine synthase (glutamine-hydrolyzing) [Deltaproteobacteria bacterium]
MCGIAGWVDWERDLSNEGVRLKLMIDKLARRGPDDGGIWLSRRAALGHRRLVVVDPIGGKQPMLRDQREKSCMLVYNGELYNSNELRKELIARGWLFESANSDTEVLLLSYMEWGEGCISHLNGIFAFAIWDENREVLFMARDRLGVKPLFYSQRGSSLLFASEIKALLVHPQVEPVIDDEGLAEILVMGPSRTPGHGIFRDIRELRPGYSLIYDRKGIKSQCYWSLQSRPHRDDIDQTKEKIRYLLQDAVDRQLVSDVPLATFLSGGLDSSAISALASHQFKKEAKGRLHTFSVDYIENDKNFRAGEFQPDPDSEWVGRVSSYLDTEHHNIIIDNHELASALIPSMQANDYPGMADIDASLFLFCREVRGMTTVALSGECADEIFGGYPWFGQRPVPMTFPWIRALQERISFLSPDIIQKIRPEEYVRERFREAIGEVPGLEGENDEDAGIRRLFYLNITRFMPTLLDRKDRMSMAWGLEVRVPFADHVLLEYVWNIPWSIKHCDNMPKGILRRALKGILPPDVLSRPKSPYPKTHSPVYLQAVREGLISILNDPGSPLLELIEPGVLRQRISGQQNIFSRPWFGQLMNDAQYMAYLIQINSWLRDYKVRID